MSLFNWSTPERENSGRVLPIIPNEIYFCIFEHIVPSNKRLTPEQLQVFTNLSCVCKLFANVCLPRVFKFVEFSPAVLHNDFAYMASREATLCTQIVAKEPLALALAKAVRECHFKRWKRHETGLSKIQRSYIAGMLHMTNIRKFKFNNNFVDAEHWNAIATLPSLEKLTFICCRFLQRPVDVEPEKRAKVKVSCLRLAYGNSGVRQLLATIDAQYLHALDIDHGLLDEVDWHSLSSLTVLHFRAYYHPCATQEEFMERLHTFLMQAPQSLETLGLVVDIDSVAQDTARRMFDDPAWKNLSFLRSLALVVVPLNMTGVLSSALEGVALLTNVKSLTLRAPYTVASSREISAAQVRCIIRDKLGPASQLEHVDICGMVLCLIDEEWLEVPSRAPIQFQ